MNDEINLKYNYIYFNTNYLPDGIIDKNEYNAICLRDAENLESCQIIPSPLNYAPRFLRKICLRHLTSRRLPLKNLWYPFIFKQKDFIQNKPICFVVATTNLPINYFSYLRKHYPNCKIVKLHRDLLKVTYGFPEYSETNMEKSFDLRMSFDKNEAQLHGFPYFHEIESKIDISQDPKYPLSDVFFAGKAKERLPKILKAYEKLTNAGLKCEFYVTHVNKKDQIKLDGITYLDKYMPYYKMLYKSINARCMLDINQEGAVGYTSRFLEAIMYNKKLIIDNPSVKESVYYNPRFIQFVKSMDEINPDFVRDDSIIVDYQYQGDFSPIHLIKQIDNELKKQEN